MSDILAIDAVAELIKDGGFFIAMLEELENEISEATGQYVFKGS